MEKKKCTFCSGRKTVRSEEEKKKMLARLKRAEGQIRGIEKMVEEDTYCPDIMIQVAAVQNALECVEQLQPCTAHQPHAWLCGRRYPRRE